MLRNRVIAMALLARELRHKRIEALGDHGASVRGGAADLAHIFRSFP